MPAEWRDVLLDDVAAEITVGHVGPMASNYVSKGIPFLRSQNVEYLRINVDDIKYITREFHERLRKSALKPGDVVIVRTGKPGTCAVVPSWLPVANCADLVIVRCGDKLDSRFLAYYVNSVASRHVAAHLVGAVQQHFNVGAARTIRMRLPEIHEQRAIVRILGTLDDKIELNRRMNETVDSIGRAVFKSWFVDFDPVHAKASGEPPESICRRFGLTPELLALFPDRLVDSELGEIPEGWEVRGLDTVAALDTTSTSPAAQPHEVFEHYSIPAFDALAMPAFDLGSTIKSNKYVVSPLAVLVSKLNPETPRVWMPAVKTQRAVCSTEFMQFVPPSRKERAYLYLMMCSDRMQAEILRRVTGSTGSRQRAQPSQIATLSVLVPAHALLESFDALAAPLLDLIARNREESQVLTAIRDALLPKLVSGELRVPLEGAA